MLLKRIFTLGLALWIGSTAVIAADQPKDVRQTAKEQNPAAAEADKSYYFLHDKSQEEKFSIHAKPAPSRPWSEIFTFASRPKDISSYGHKIDWLFNYTTAVAFIYFLIMAVAMVVFIWIYRTKPGRKAFYTHGGGKITMLTIFTGAIVYLSLDIVLTRDSKTSGYTFIWNRPGPEALRVQIMPQQWAWNIRYAGDDNTFNTPDDIVTINELRVPKDRQVYVQIKSKDVIHGFYIPNVRKQIDAMPGKINHFWFDALELGDFEIACAHLCGTAHYKMKGFLKVVEASDFEAWAKEQSRWAAAKFDPEDKLKQWGWNWEI